MGPAPSSTTRDVCSVQGTQEPSNGSSETTLKEENARNAAAENGQNENLKQERRRKLMPKEEGRELA